jgi:DNA sulfur modification protein DndB
LYGTDKNLKTFSMETHPILTFPVIRGCQAGRECYVAMWTLRMLRQIAIFDEDEVCPELRTQRPLNRARIREMSNYILNNPDSYIFPPLTVSIDFQAVFEPLVGQNWLGNLRVPMDAHFVMNDGQHRRAALIEALDQRPELGQETIPILFFLDIGLEHCQQRFADLNRHAVRLSSFPGTSDYRSPQSRLARRVITKSAIFQNIVEMEKTSLAKRSRKLFTLSAFHHACADLIDGIATGILTEDADLARSYWEAVAEQIPVWGLVQQGQLSASEVREDFIHCHSIALQALGRAGNALIKLHPEKWRERLTGLRQIDWSRHNSGLWEGQALVGGRVSRMSIHVARTTDIIKQMLGLPINEKATSKKDRACSS